jgi:hypothetical protein
VNIQSQSLLCLKIKSGGIQLVLAALRKQLKLQQDSNVPGVDLKM